MSTTRKPRITNNLLWGFYTLFVVIAIATHQGEPLFSVAGAYGWGKAIAWLMLAAFISYSLYCSTKENFLKTMATIKPYHWFRQISIDLYIGVFVMLCVIYLNEGSLLIVALWFIPCLIMANLATLLYIALNYQSLVAHFL